MSEKICNVFHHYTLGPITVYLTILKNIQKLPEKCAKYGPFFADSDVMLALDSRQFDHVAKEFLIKEKRKL